jgi:hypothetical protein
VAVVPLVMSNGTLLVGLTLMQPPRSLRMLCPAWSALLIEELCSAAILSCVRGINVGSLDGVANLNEARPRIQLTAFDDRVLSQRRCRCLVALLCVSDVV